VREALENYILSKRAGKAQYLCSGITIYIHSGKEIQGDRIEDKRKQMRTELHT